MQLLNLIIHMQVALALRLYAIWSVVENFLVLFYPKLHWKRVITYIKLFEQILSRINEVPVRLVK